MKQENECANKVVLGGIKAAVFLSSFALVRFGSELFFSSFSICATCCSVLNSALSALAHSTVGDSVWPCPRCFSSRGSEQAGATRFATSVCRCRSCRCAARRFHRRRRERGRARTRTLLPKLEGRVGLPNYLPTLLPTFPCPYCPWRSSNHLCRRSTLGLVSRVPPPLPRSIVLERKVNLVLTDGLKRSELGESRWHCLSA